MIRVLFAGILLVSTFAACSKSEESTENIESVLVRFNNQTEKTIHSIVIDDDYVLGTLKQGEKTGYISFKTFGTDTGMPDVNFIGTIDGKILSCTNRFYWCGTEKATLETGKYNVNIRIVTIDNEDYFELHFENRNSL